MMLDTVTLRVSFGVVALTMLLLFYFVTYRTTRSVYCAWWCAALSLFLAGSAAYLFDGTAQQRWANPLGNALLVGGAASVWAGTRAIKGQRTHAVLLGAPVLVTTVVSAFDSPATNEWSGAPVFLGCMSILLGLASIELWTAAPRSAQPQSREKTYAPILRSLAIMAALLSAFYVGRTIAFIAVGQDGRLFDVYFGTELTTLITTVLLTTISFSMTALSHADDTLDLRARATHDGLTGLLNRTEFMRLAASKWRSGRRSGAHGSVILADLDHFKSINDLYGHPAGDYALQTFAATCRGVVRSTDLVGRYGGEEFILFLDGGPPERAQQVAAEISDRLRTTQTPEGMSLPTVSYGVAYARSGDRLDETIELADHALYEAKTLGRDRTVLATSRSQGREAS
ncbi:MAG: GGDEF domain-containing protein [Aeromicrobium sp.]